MRITTTIATLPAGPYVTQYGRRATCTLLAPAEMGQPQNYGRCAWDDATTPRTDRPVRFFALAYQRGAGVETRSFVTGNPDTIPMRVA